MNPNSSALREDSVNQYHSAECSIVHVQRYGEYRMKDFHAHSFYEIIYVRRGERLYFIGDCSYRIQPGSLVFIDCGVEHRAISTEVPGHESIVMAFHKQLAGEEFCTLLAGERSPFRSRPPVLPLQARDQLFVEELLERMKRELEHKHTAFPLALRGLLMELTIHALRRMESRTAGSEAQTHHKRVEEVVRYLNRHFDEQLTLSELAERFQLNVYYLSRSFRKYTGATITETLASIRIGEAQKLLRETQLRVTDIAYQVGFRNIAHFGKVFKTSSGCTPRQYRSRNS